MTRPIHFKNQILLSFQLIPPRRRANLPIYSTSLSPVDFRFGDPSLNLWIIAPLSRDCRKNSELICNCFSIYSAVENNTITDHNVNKQIMCLQWAKSACVNVYITQYCYLRAVAAIGSEHKIN